MPFKKKSSGGIEFVRLPLTKSVYGVEKGQEGRKYFYLRRFDFDGVQAESLSQFAGSALQRIASSTAEDDWMIPIHSSEDLDYEMLGLFDFSENVRKLLSLPAESRPWFSVVKTPNGVTYFAKRRISASSTLQAIGLGASLFNPVTAIGAVGWFARKQEFKYRLAKSRGEQDPSIMPKAFVYKIWQVSLKDDIELIYQNIVKVLDGGDAWNEWS